MSDILTGLVSSEADLIYRDSDFEIRQPGGYVVCAITGNRIPLDELKYWSVDRQEPYEDAAASLEAHQKN